uniref:Uncharacterized protein n=1 Tax=Octopus bimaculoides TaxID=37653 RepID=A0A0L8IGU7_OCTBM
MKARCPQREEKQLMELSEEQEKVDEVVQDGVKETVSTDDSFTVVKNEKEKKEGRKGEKEDKEVEKDVEKEVANVFEKEFEKELEEELEEELEKEVTVARLLATLTEEEDLGGIERQQHESEAVTLTKIEEEKDRMKAPSVEQGKNKQMRMPMKHKWNFVTYAKSTSIEKKIMKFFYGDLHGKCESNCYR